MEYTIRPAEPRDAGDISALRRMPGVFETILGNPGESRKKTCLLYTSDAADEL